MDIISVRNKYWRKGIEILKAKVGNFNIPMNSASASATVTALELFQFP